MSKLKIIFETDLKMAKSILNKVQFFIYKNRLNALMKVIKARLKKYKSKEEGEKFTFIDEGTKEYIEKEKQKLEEFLFGESDDLLSSPEIQKIKTDRVMHKLTTMIRKAKQKTRDKAIKAALMGNNVIGFFMKMGIMVIWEVSE